MIDYSIFIIGSIFFLTILICLVIYSIRKNKITCPHNNKSTYVESTVCGVEITTIRCLGCGKKITHSNTEVR